MVTFFEISFKHAFNDVIYIMILVAKKFLSTLKKKEDDLMKTRD